MSVAPRIVALWTAPRSISSAYERCLSQHGEVETFFEPFFNVYFFSRWRQADDNGDFEKALDYGPAEAVQLLHSGKAPVAFFKEMASIYWPYKDREFLASVKNTFLIRRPEFSLNGWLKMGKVPDENRFGFTRLRELWRLVTQELGQEPIVVEASAFQNNPARVLQQYCTRIGIEFDPAMLSWEPKEHQTWAPELMTDESWLKWQAILNQSTTILPAPKELPVIPAEHEHLLEEARKVYAEISAYAI